MLPIREPQVIPETPELSDAEFAQFRTLLHRLAGIHLSNSKKPLVRGRLAKRLKHYRLAGYGEYLRLICSADESGELQIALDLLTTNETRFFREPPHFDLLRNRILPERRPNVAFRVWSAACSSGEEPYSIAMLLADQLDTTAAWEIIASDISSRVLERARHAKYPMARAEQIPKNFLRNYCLKGVGSCEGTFAIMPELRKRVRFLQINLNEPLQELGEFDVIFLRNVMIYFDTETKRGVVQRLIRHLRPGGYLIIGHSETLNGICDGLRTVMPSVYQLK
jgi:chemotaxis protein methyltransferase CheR